MKRLLIFSAFACSLFSCTKDKVNGPLVLKSIETPGKPDTKVAYTFDNQNRLTCITYADGMKSTYTFSGSQVQAYIYENDPSYYLQGTGTLNSAGNLVQFTGTRYDNGASYPYLFEAEYDANGQMTKSSETANGTVYVHEFTWTDGNITKIKEYKNGTYQRYYEFSYYTDRINKKPIDHMNSFEESTGGITGRQNKNDMASYKAFSPAGQLQYEDQYQYEYNSAGYISKQSRTYVQGNKVTETVFNY